MMMILVKKILIKRILMKKIPVKKILMKKIPVKKNKYYLKRKK